MDENKKTVDEYQRLTPNEYIKLRLDNQQKWFSTKSSNYQKWYKWLKRIEVFLLAFIPLITIFPFVDNIYNQIGVILLSAIAGFFKLLNVIGCYFDLWVKYRNISERLKTEKFLYLAHTNVYSDTNKAFSLLVERVENIIAQSNNQWIETIKDTEKVIRGNQSSTNS